MKTIKSTPISKFLTTHNLTHLLVGVADMPPSVPLLVWLNDAVQDDITLGKADKKKFAELCKREQEITNQKKPDRPAAKKNDDAKRRRGFLLGMLGTMI